jgi:hypothetical protein
MQISVHVLGEIRETRMSTSRGWHLIVLAAGPFSFLQHSHKLLRITWRNGECSESRYRMSANRSSVDWTPKLLVFLPVNTTVPSHDIFQDEHKSERWKKIINNNIVTKNKNIRQSINQSIKQSNRKNEKGKSNESSPFRWNLS